METTTRRYRTPPEEGPPNSGKGGGLRYEEPLAPVPIWILTALTGLPLAEVRVILALYAHTYRTLPWGEPLSVREIARMVGRSPRTTKQALVARRRAGWVHETPEGRWGLGAEPLEEG